MTTREYILMVDRLRGELQKNSDFKKEPIAYVSRLDPEIIGVKDSIASDGLEEHVIQRIESEELYNRLYWEYIYRYSYLCIKIMSMAYTHPEEEYLLSVILSGVMTIEQYAEEDEITVSVAKKRLNNAIDLLEEETHCGHEVDI